MVWLNFTNLVQPTGDESALHDRAPDDLFLAIDGGEHDVAGVARVQKPAVQKAHAALGDVPAADRYFIRHPP